MLAQERERVHWEEQRKAMQADMHNKAELARFEDELARKRADVEHDKQRARQVELVRCAQLRILRTLDTSSQCLHAAAPTVWSASVEPVLSLLTSCICRLQEESSANQEAKKLEVQAQIEAERRATEQYRVCPDLVDSCSHVLSRAIVLDT